MNPVFLGGVLVGTNTSVQLTSTVIDSSILTSYPQPAGVKFRIDTRSLDYTVFNVSNYVISELHLLGVG
jgi:hypothetical protein